ncbi:MAG: type II secretion system minor pseudopilin GspK [Gammaproteobacteria bacterium]
MKAVLRPPHTAHQARGVALLTALLVVAIVAIIAVGMASRQQLDIRRTGNVFDGDQAYLYALGVESWAQGVLRKDLQQDRRTNAVLDDLGEGWATVLPPIDVEGGKVAGVITDMQGRFNVNNLLPRIPADQQGQPNPADPADKDKAIFMHLLTTATEVNADVATEMTEAVQDWLDADDVRRLNGAEEVDYLRLTPPYRTANALLSSPSELLLIKGFTPQIYALIAPSISTLPVITKINVNTASAQVIKALADGISSAQAEKAVADRKLRPFKNLQDFYTQLGANPQQQQVMADKIGVASEYFLLSAHAETGRGQVQLYSLLGRRMPPPPAPQQVNVKVIMRGQGTY